MPYATLGGVRDKGITAAASNVSAYAVDKVLWLIGSGKFYEHPDIGRNGRVGKKKE